LIDWTEISTVLPIVFYVTNMSDDLHVCECMKLLKTHSQETCKSHDTDHCTICFECKWQRSI